MKYSQIKLESGVLRLVLVTAFTFILGTAPVVFADHGGPVVFVDIKNLPEDDTDCDFHFRTIKAALDPNRCPPQEEFTTIIVDPGVYDEGMLEVNVKGLIIKSSGGAERTKINGCFNIIAKKVELRGFDINAVDCDVGVTIADREVKVLENIIHEAKIDGILVGDDSDGTTLANNRLFNNSRNGIYVLGDNHEIEITQNEVESNGAAGIFFQGNADRFTISNNDVGLNNGVGILLLGADDGQITDNTVTANKLHGIQLDKSNDNVIVNNVVTSNGEFGISIVDSDNNEVRANELASNRAGGVALTGNGEPAQRNTVESNQINAHISAAGASGILLRGNVTASIILKNTIVRNSFGVRLILNPPSQTAPSNNTIDNNEIRASAEDGILVEASFGLNLFRSNQIVSNTQVGIHIMGGSGNDEIANNVIQDNGDDGIRIEESDRNTIRDNEITLNGGGDGSGGVNDGGGIVLIKANSTTVRKNLIHDGEANGILLREVESTRIIENIIERHQQDGVNGVDVISLLLQGNLIQSNRERGVAVKKEKKGCSDIDLQLNIITDNTLGGVFFADCERVRLQMNEITDNPRFGLWVQDSNEVSARRNWWGDPKGPAGIFEGHGNAVIMINVVIGGDSTRLGEDLILAAVMPWLTDRLNQQIEASVTGFLLQDFGPGEVELDAMNHADVRLSLFSVAKEERGIAIVAKYLQPLPTENSVYNVAPLEGAVKTVSVLTSGFGTGTAIVEVGYDDTELPEGVAKETLRLFYWDGSSWVPLSGKSMENVNLVEGEIDVTLLREGAIIALAPQA